ncbi:MAG: Hpt domain-containing protein [Bacteroidetes bacterium]|nr:Hpt domain-containing protein [Bacteroidota bacterium]
MSEIPRIEKADQDLLTRLQELEQELDRDFAIEMAEMFIADSPSLIEAIQQSIDARDSTALAQSAHKLKGSSLNIGATRLGALCLELELLGKSGNPIPPETSVQAVLTEFERVKKILLQFVGKV